MTINQVKSKIKRDIVKLTKEQAVLKNKPTKRGRPENDHLLVYLITRKNTLKEVLKMLGE